MQKKKTTNKILTESELELMNIIWELGECNVKDVQSRLNEQKRDLAYTSVATFMKILEQKKFLVSHKRERAHTYAALISRDDYEATSLKHLADGLFHGDPSHMVMRLLNDGDLSEEELKAIRALLEQRIKS